MIRLIGFAGALALLMTASAGGAKAEDPFASGSFKDACAVAGKTKRIVLVDFYTTWCGPCKMLDQKTWKDSKVREWLSKVAVSRKIDAEKEKALAEHYKIRAYPTILLLKPDGTEIDRLVGYRDPKDFLVEARQALSGQDSIARAKAKLNAAGQDNPMARMEYAGALAEKGRNAEALKEYLWCLDEGNKHEQGFYGVRLSFLLNDIKTLGQAYPAALNAIILRRDVARAALEKGTADRDIAVDYAAYNESLGQAEQTLATYDALKAKDATTAPELFEQVSGLLLQKKRYADLVAGAGDISARMNLEISSYNQILSEPQLDQQVRTFMKQSVVDKASAYYEALVGTDAIAAADALRGKLLAFDASVGAYTALVKHAVRADRPEQVGKLVALAKKALSPTDFKQVDQAAK